MGVGTWLTALGLTCEVGGALWVGIEVALTREGERGQPMLPRRLWHRIRAAVGHKQHASAGASLKASYSIEAAGRLKPGHLAGPDAPVDQRLSAIEQNITQIRRELDALGQEATRETAERKAAIQAADDDMREVAETLRQERKDSALRDLSRELRGLWVFAFGAVLSTVANFF